MTWLTTLLSRFTSAYEWRDIASAPFDRELELAVIDTDIGVLDFCCIRHGSGWLYAETLRPVDIAATHWRFPRSAILPVCCC